MAQQRPIHINEMKRVSPVLAAVVVVNHEKCAAAVSALNS